MPSGPTSSYTALLMPSAGEIDRSKIAPQVAAESDRRARLAVPGFAAGVLYLLSGIILSATLKALPTVGVIQALAPALRAEPNPTVSPRVPEVGFVDHHAFGLIAGSVLQAISIAILLLILLFLLGAIRFRRPESTSTARPLILAGGVVLAVTVFAHQVVQAITAHNFITHHDLTNHAVDQALTQGSSLQVTTYLGFVAGVVLAAGMIVVMMGAVRTGLLPRWMTYLGIFAAVLAFTPIGVALGFIQQLLPAFWLVAMGMLLTGRLPGGDPPAWAAGQARPWPSPADRRSERGGEQARQTGSKGAREHTQPRQAPSAVADVAPEPARAASSRSRKRRRRKRAARG